MFGLKKAGENTYYIDYPSRIGIYVVNNSDAYFIDSGNDSRSGSHALKVINESGWKLKAIFNTHCHADHVGGNAVLQRETGCKIYCPAYDCGAVSHTLLNPTMLYGAYPTKELTHKFYLAEESVAEDLTPNVLPKGLETIPLKGHTLGMVGYKTADNVYFLADSVVSPEVLNKYLVTYIFSVQDYLKTLDFLEMLPSGTYIPAHIGAISNIKPVVSENRRYVYKVIDEILKICEQPQLFDNVVKAVFDNNTLSFNMMQYALIGSTVKSYLSYLKEQGLVEIQCTDNLIYWKRV